MILETQLRGSLRAIQPHYYYYYYYEYYFYYEYDTTFLLRQLSIYNYCIIVPYCSSLRVKLLLEYQCRNYNKKVPTKATIT